MAKRENMRKFGWVAGLMNIGFYVILWFLVEMRYVEEEHLIIALPVLGLTILNIWFILACRRNKTFPNSKYIVSFGILFGACVVRALVMPMFYGIAVLEISLGVLDIGHIFHTALVVLCILASSIIFCSLKKLKIISGVRVYIIMLICTLAAVYIPTLIHMLTGR